MGKMADKPLYYGNSKSGPMYYGSGSGSSPMYYGAGPAYGGKRPMYYGQGRKYCGAYGGDGFYGFGYQA